MTTAQPRRPRKPSPSMTELEETRQLLVDLQQLAARAAEDAAKAREQQQEVGPKILALHAALMVPQPGHQKSLLDRMAAVTISVETGDRTMRALVRTASVLGAIGVIVGAWLTITRWTGGTPPTNHGG